MTPSHRPTVAAVPSDHDSTTANLKSLIFLSSILDADPKISAIANVNIIETSATEENITLCYLPILLTFNMTSNGIFHGLASAALAIEHLNTGNGTIVPELSELNQRCPLRFVIDAFDTKEQANHGVDVVIDLTDRSKQGELIPCAIIGADWSSISMPTSVISGLRGFPQISMASTSSELDDKSQYKLFGRTIPNDDGTSEPLVTKLVSWGVRYFAVLHVDDSYGNAFARGIRTSVLKEASILRVETFPLKAGADDHSISEAIMQLKGLQFTYFFAIIRSDDADKVMTEAYTQGIAGTGQHTWIFSDIMGSHLTGRNFLVGSPLEKVYKGASVLVATGSSISGLGFDGYDKLSKSIQILGENEADRSYLDELFPEEHAKEISVNTAGVLAPFMYDAVVAIGLASCDLVDTNQSSAYNITGENLFSAFLNTSFNGTSGSIVFDPVTGTRDPSSAIFSLKNFVADEDYVLDSNVIQFKERETDLFLSGDWVNVQPFIFNDGTASIPVDLPTLETNENYLSTWLKAVGLILCVQVILLALGSSYWTFRNSRKSIVRSSQPLFLQLISAGSLLMGLAIIPLSLDRRGVDAACMSFPWLITIGFSLTFSALSTKTHRINKLVQSAKRFQRLKITPLDVIKPMIALLMMNIIILTVWTVIDPLRRETVVVAHDQFDRNVETYGICTSDHALIFLATLGAINLGSLLHAVFQAYQARGISTELQESSYIFTAMAFILIEAFIGIPVIFIARENVKAFYFVAAGLVYVVCISILSLIFIPKMLALKKSKRLRRPSSLSTAPSNHEVEGIKILTSPLVIVQMEQEIQNLKMMVAKLESSTHKGDSAVDVDDSLDMGLKSSAESFCSCNSNDLTA